MWRPYAAVACILLGLPVQHPSGARAAWPCAPVIRAVLRLPGRVDSLVPATGATIALAAAAPDGPRFLPHDNVVILRRDGRIHARVPLPPYTTPPGLVLDPQVRGIVRVVVDGELLALDVEKGRIAAHAALDVQALGWPAAVIAGSPGRLYIVGQPARERAATLEALALHGVGRAHVEWRASLGLTHAGIWLGPAAGGRVAAYLPDAYDQQGTVALFDARSGAVIQSYAVPAPPIASDPTADRLYLDDAGTIMALSLRRGERVASVRGTGPLVVDATRGLVAYARDGGVALAAARTLAPLGHVPAPDTTALAVAPAGATLLIGRRDGLSLVDVSGCVAR